MPTHDKRKADALKDVKTNNVEVESENIELVLDDDESDVFKLFCSDYVYAKFIENIILMFTWGILFPYLTVLIKFSMYIDKLNWRTTVSSYLYYMIKNLRQEKAIAQLR